MLREQYLAGIQYQLEHEDPITVGLMLADLYLREVLTNQKLEDENKVLRSQVALLSAKTATELLRSQMTAPNPVLEGVIFSDTEKRILNLLKSVESVFDSGLTEQEVEARIGTVFFSLVNLRDVGAIYMECDRDGCDRIKLTSNVKFEVRP